MSNKEHLIEQHIREYESRMRHIDELFVQAHEAASEHDEGSEAHVVLSELKEQRSQLPQSAEEASGHLMEHVQEDTLRSAGPMAVWDILAQKLEDFVERHT